MDNIKKWRIALTAEEVAYLHDLLVEAEDAQVELRSALTTKMGILRLKVDGGLLKATYESKVKLPLMEAIGASSDKKGSGNIAKAREACYAKYVETGRTGEGMSDQEREQALTFGYQNDVLSQAEIEYYEATCLDL